MQVRSLNVSKNFCTIILIICCKLLVDKDILCNKKDRFVDIFIEIIVRNRIDNTI